MDWNGVRSKHSSISGVQPISGYPDLQLIPWYPVSAVLNENDPVFSHGLNESRTSYFESQHPIYCADWKTCSGRELVALSSFREGYQNRIQIAHGTAYHRRNDDVDDNTTATTSTGATDPTTSSEDLLDSNGSYVKAYNFCLATEAPVHYPVTHLQWDPLGYPRIAASLEVLRLYQYTDDLLAEPSLVQTHLLANNSSAHSSGADSQDINTFPPVTSFDWNKTDPSIIITSSVDTTCTVWDLNRSISTDSHKNSALVKTQLIAHDSEVFDVKFIHKSTNVFASVSNDGSMRVFDLRSLEHSTIIYEPSLSSPSDCFSGPNAGVPYNPQALLRLLASNVDQHHLATVGVNLNQVLIIDMRMPGVPVATLDGLFGGISQTAINLIVWNPTSNLLLTGGDDCQALVWDFTRGVSSSARTMASQDGSAIVEIPDLAYLEELEVNNVCWQEGGSGNWMGVVSGKSFQAVQTW